MKRGGENDNRDTLHDADICARADQMAASPKIYCSLEGTRRAEHSTATNTPTPRTVGKNRNIETNKRSTGKRREGTYLS
mgnify:CR=1 FL=1